MNVLVAIRTVATTIVVVIPVSLAAELDIYCF